MPTEDPITERLARYISQALDAPLPDEVVQRARLHLLDSFAAMVSGSVLPAGRMIAQFHAAEEIVSGCSVPATALSVSVSNAALAGGVMAHSDETDDSHAPSLTHPGCAVVPAALAVAQIGGQSGRDLLRSVVLGYDIGTRISMALGGSAFADTYHQSSHAWAGTFGATAAAAALYRLGPTAVRYALSYAVHSASGSRCWLRDPDHVQKAYVFGGMPARSGVDAARFAAAGFTGVSDAIEGTPGLFAAFARTARPRQATDALGERFEVMRTTIKKWCVGSPLQMPLDCIDHLVSVHGLTEANVAAIEISLPEARSRVAQSAMPDVNLPHAMALYLVDRGVSFQSLHDHARLSDPAVRRVAARVSVVPRPGAARGEQAHFTLETRDGRVFELAPDHVRGQPADPMSEDEVAAKARDLLGMAFGPERVTRLVDAFLGIDEVKDVAALRHIWTP